MKLPKWVKNDELVKDREKNAINKDLINLKKEVEIKMQDARERKKRGFFGKVGYTITHPRVSGSEVAGLVIGGAVGGAVGLVVGDIVGRQANKSMKRNFIKKMIKLKKISNEEGNEMLRYY